MIDLERFKSVILGVDCAIFTTDKFTEDNPHRDDERRLQVLLIRRNTEPYRGMWSLPGGLVENDRTIEDTLDIKLLHKINLNDFYKEQLYTYSEVSRDPRGRVISSAYIGVVYKDAVVNIKDMGRGEPRWFWVHLDRQDNVKIIDSVTNEGIDELAFDHRRIIKDALLRLRNKLEYTDMLYRMLPREFTIGELQDIFEEILGKHKQSFRRYIGNRIIETDRFAERRAHRPAKLYRYSGEF